MHIVTGGAGFIGSAFVWKLNQAGIDDVLVVDDLGHGEKWRNLVNRRYADYLHKDAFLARVERGEDFGAKALIHMGACSATTELDAEYLMRNNFAYSRTLCRYCLSRGIRFVNASSAATYGDGALGFDDDVSRLESLKPLNMYGYSKHLLDLWARREKVLSRIVSLKFFNVFGPNEYHKGDMKSVACKAFAQIRQTGRVRLFKSRRPDYPDGGQRRDFVYVKDVAETMWRFLEKPEVGGLFNLGSGRSRTFRELVEATFAAMGRTPDIEYVDMPEAISEKYQYFTEAAMDRAKAALGPLPFTSLEEAVADYVTGHLAKADAYL